jgi:heme exporter protein C
MTGVFAMRILANPNRFLKFAAAVLPWCSVATVVLFALGLYFAIFASPPDYQQGESVRIMYVHVPAAWMAMMVYGLLALFAAASLIWRHPLADVMAKAAAPIGAGFTLIALVTGSLWGEPTWGTWWQWDARLTSVLVLFFFYLGHMALTVAFDDATRGARAAAILALVGVINLPIIKFSVEWWSTLHQPASILRLGAPTIDPSMLTPLFLMAGAFLGYFLCLLILRTRAELAARRVRTLRLLAADDAVNTH